MYMLYVIIILVIMTCFFLPPLIVWRSLDEIFWIWEKKLRKFLAFVALFFVSKFPFLSFLAIRKWWWFEYTLEKAAIGDMFLICSRPRSSRMKTPLKKNSSISQASLKLRQKRHQWDYCPLGDLKMHFAFWMLVVLSRNKWDCKSCNWLSTSAIHLAIANLFVRTAVGGEAKLACCGKPSR